VFKNHSWALLTAFIVSINSHIIFGSIGENQDILVAVLLLWTFYLVLRSPEQKRTWFFVGLIIGIASLLKQYSIAFLIIYVPIILIEYYKKGIKLWIITIGCLAFGTLLGSLPQLIVNTIVHLNPFYNYALQSGQLVTIVQNLNMYSRSLGRELNITLSHPDVLLTLFHSIRSNYILFILHWFDGLRFYNMCLKLVYYVVAVVILFISKESYKKFLLENTIIISVFLGIVSMAAYLEKGTYLPVVLTSLVYVPTGAALANLKPKIIFKPIGIILVIYVTMFAPIIEPKTFKSYSGSMVYIDQPRYGTIKDSISEIIFFNTAKKVSKDVSYVLNLNGLKSPMEVLATPGYLYYDNTNDPYKLKDAFRAFVDFSQARQKSKMEKLNIINNLEYLRDNKLFQNVKLYMPYYSPGPTPYFFDKDFWVLFPDVWFSNLFELEHVMEKYRIKFVILNKKWVESNLPLFPNITNNASLNKQFKPIYRYQDDYYVYQLVR
jgi:hypothetical protein